MKHSYYYQVRNCF